MQNDNDNISAPADITSTLPRMVGFSLPALGLNTLVTAVFVFLPPLYTEHQQMWAATVGTVFLLAKFVDFIAAPSWGLFMDSYTTRWGRRRPWLALSTPMLMLAILMLYNPPESASLLYLFVWLSVLYVGWSAWTISHTSWALELSRDYDRRSRITGLLQLMAMVGGIMIALVPAIMERVTSPTFIEKTSAIATPASVLEVTAVSLTSGWAASRRNNSTPVYPVPPTTPTVIIILHGRKLALYPALDAFH